MWDLGMIAAVLAFFALSVGLVAAFEKLRR
jgi:hypothetical protein